MRAVTMAVVLIVGTAKVGRTQETPSPAAPLPPWLPITVCVVENGALREIQVRYAEGDSLTLDGRRFVEAHPVDGRYAAATAWFNGDEALRLPGGIYRKYGQPRALGIREVVPAGHYQGVPVFVEAGLETGGRPPEVVYLPVRPGCDFQPYVQVEV